MGPARYFSPLVILKRQLPLQQPLSNSRFSITSPPVLLRIRCVTDHFLRGNMQTAAEAYLQGLFQLKHRNIDVRHS
mgnify:CR=1 FL=1